MAYVWLPAGTAVLGARASAATGLQRSSAGAGALGGTPAAAAHCGGFFQHSGASQLHVGLGMQGSRNANVSRRRRGCQASKRSRGAGAAVGCLTQLHQPQARSHCLVAVSVVVIRFTGFRAILRPAPGPRHWAAYSTASGRTAGRCWEAALLRPAAAWRAVRQLGCAAAVAQAAGAPAAFQDGSSRSRSARARPFATPPPRPPPP